MIEPTEPSHWDTVVQLASQLPEVEEGRNYGMPALRVQRRFFAWLRADEEVLVVRVNQFARKYLLEANPAVYFITNHYLNYPSVLIHLSKVGREELADALAESWLMVAPKRLAAQFDSQRQSPPETRGPA